MPTSSTPNSSVIIRESGDFSGGSTSKNNVEVGDIVFGTTAESDTDTFAVYLEAGVQYAIASAASDGDAVKAGQVGIYEQDTTLTLYNSSGTQIAYDDYSGAAYNSLLLYTPSSSGTYYVETGVWQEEDISLDYQLAIFNFEALDYIAWVQGLDTGDNMDTLNPEVYFFEDGEKIEFGGGLSFTADGFNAYEISQFQEVFDLIEAITQLEFTIVYNSSNADLFPALDTDENFPYLGLFNPPGYFYQGNGGFNGAQWDRSPGGNLEKGGLGFITIVHELLHGLGLAHPHDSGGQSATMPGVFNEYTDTGYNSLNQGVYTTMTYIDGYVDGTTGSAINPNNPDYGYQATPMALDIAMLQLLYGVKTNYKNGDNTYYLPTSNSPGTYWSSIWDTGGDDTMAYTGSRNATIDLRDATLEDAEGGGGYVSSANGIAGGYTIANAVTIENASGGSGNDKITGNDVDNVLKGNVGNDNIKGYYGDDIIYGGAGNDYLVGHGGEDTLSGGSGTDRLFGGGGADRMFGGGGKDVFYGGDGADFMYGQKGSDIMYGDAGIDRIEGGNGNDAIAGGNGDDLIFGGNGLDDLYGGNGADRLYGGNGNDKVKAGFGNDIMRGDNGNDILVGHAGHDRMFGNNGADSLYGGAHDDYLHGGYGNDLLKGGAGADVFVFNAGKDKILDLDGADTIQIDSALVGNKTAAQVMTQYASVTADGVLIDFGDDELLITNTTSLDFVQDNLEII